MKEIKKYIGTLLTAGLILSTSLPTQAAFTSQGIQTRTATVTFSAAGTVAMTVSIKKMADNSAAGNLAWTTAAAGSNWTNSDDYIQLDSTITASNGGIQIYTDNVHATPAYTGTINATSQSPAGLVDNNTTTKVLPLAWSIKDLTVGTTGPINAEPNNNGIVNPTTDPNAFQWLYFEDSSQVANNQHASLFVPGDPFITVDNSTGIHFGQSTTEFGAAASPNFIYVQANFVNALTPDTYSTNKLILEAFTQ